MSADRHDSGRGRRDEHRGQGGGAPQGRRDQRGHQRSGSRARGGERAYSKQAPGQRARTSDQPRLVAYEVLRAVHAEDAYANLELADALKRHRLSGRDAGFATELVYGTLRSQGRLDRIVAANVTRSWDDVEEKVRDVLRLGAHQLLGMRVPAHAATSETVALARQVAGAGSATFVNAVLRSVGERSTEEWLDRIVPAATTDPVERLAVEHSHPQWIVRALSDALAAHGRSRDELPDLLAAQNASPRVDLVIRPGLAEVSELLEHGAAAGRLSPFAAQWPSGDPGGIATLRDGRAAVEDEGSQVVAAALVLGADPVAPAEDAHWLDLCAGPGGKTALLAGLSVEHGADLDAVELHPHRADLVRENVRTLVDAGADVEVRAGDGRTVGAEAPGRYARVLVDAPCTGLGALRRRPEARWRRKPSDVSELASLQRQLLVSALDATAPGGLVAYVTCSPHVAETRLVVQDVLRKRDDAHLVDARDAVRESLLPEARDTDLGTLETVQLWPHVHGTDAMFLALIRRT
jgi:16S rRNA (cytosine967-C5)-methyltransferase